MARTVRKARSRSGIGKRTLVLLAFLTLAPWASPALAETMEERIRKLEETIQRQQEVLKEQQKALEELKELSKQTKAPPPSASASPSRDYRLDDKSRGIYVESAAPLTPYSLTKAASTPNLMNPAIAFILDTFYYGSSLSREELDGRNSPGFRRSLDTPGPGFNLRNVEMTVFAPVDPYFNLHITVPIDENGATVEEAYFLTTSLPAGFQVKGGKFRSGFGRFNAFHPHTWDFVDPPLPYALLIGGEGLIEKGGQVTYLPGLPVYTILGAEILQGDNEVLFGSGAQSGPHAYTGFLKASLDFGDSHSILFGGSAVGGKTKTGSFAPNTQFQADTALYGLELTYKWKPSRWRSFVMQSEYLYRRQTGDLTDQVALVVNPLNRDQDGFYVQALYQFDRWRVGGRFDRLAVFADSVTLGGRKVSYSGQPYRATGTLEFNPTEFSRIRLQYNYDRAARAERENHEIYLQFILAVGAHGAHAY